MYEILFTAASNKVTAVLMVTLSPQRFSILVMLEIAAMLSALAQATLPGIR